MDAISWPLASVIGGGLVSTIGVLAGVVKYKDAQVDKVTKECAAERAAWMAERRALIDERNALETKAALEIQALNESRLAGAEARRADQIAAADAIKALQVEMRVMAKEIAERRG